MNCTAIPRDELPEIRQGLNLVTTSGPCSRNSRQTLMAPAPLITEIKDHNPNHRHQQHRTSHRLTSCLRGERDEAEGNFNYFPHILVIALISQQCRTSGS